MGATTNVFRNTIDFVFKSRTRIILVLIILCILGYSGWKVLGQKSTKPQYQTAQATKDNLITSITASGSVSAGNSADITTQVSGVVSQIYVKNGDTVAKGDKIADVELDQASLAKQASSYANYVAAANALQTAQNNQHTAQISLEKALDDIHLFQYGNGGFSNVGTANETETQKLSRTTAEEAKNNADSSVNTAQAALNAAWLSYQQTSSTVIAPISGTITNLSLAPGTAISSTSSSSSGSSTTTSSNSYGSVILDNSQVKASVDVSEIDAPKVKVGQKATLTLDAFPDKTFTGKVDSINTTGTVSSGVTTYPTTIIFDTTVSGIYPNMAVSATIITNIKNNVVLVPTAAVTTSNGSTTVKVIKNGQVQTVDVTTGDSNDTSTEITSGINEGDTVVTGQAINQTTKSGTGTSIFSGTRGGFGIGRPPGGG